MLAILPPTYFTQHLFSRTHLRKRSQKPLQRCSLPSLEKAFQCDQVNSVELFYHDHGILILRQFEQTRLPSAESCLEQAGFSVSERQYSADQENHTWSTFQARKPKNRLNIRSIIKTSDQTQSWPSFQDWQESVTPSNKTFLAITELHPMR